VKRVRSGAPKQAKRSGTFGSKTGPDHCAATVNDSVNEATGIRCAIKRAGAIRPSAVTILRALALAQGRKLESARSVLEAHGLADRFDALQNFPGGWTWRQWLFR
jgi:hypothetical protein